MTKPGSPRLTCRDMNPGLALAIAAALAILSCPALADALALSEAKTLVFVDDDLLLSAGGLWSSEDGGASWSALPSVPGSALLRHS